MSAAGGEDRALGKLVSAHETTARGFIKLAALVLVSLAIACGLLHLGIFSGDTNIGGRIIVSILGSFFLLPVGLGLFGLVRGRHNGLFIYERGLAIRNAGTMGYALWDDIAGYDGDLFLVIETKTGGRFDCAMDGLRDAAAIVETLRAEVTTQRRVPQLLKTLREGKIGSFMSDAEAAEGDARLAVVDPPPSGTLDVSGFTLDASGVTPVDAEESIPWTAITECRAERKVLTVGKMLLSTSYVLVVTEANTFRTVMNATSNRDSMVELCEAMMTGAKRPDTTG